MSSWRNTACATTVRALRDTPLLRAGEEARGHEFHHSAWEGAPPDTPRAYGLQDARGECTPEGYARGDLLASYIHLHFWSMPVLAARFVAACRAHAERSSLRTAGRVP